MAAQPYQPNPSQAASAQANTQMFYNGRSSIDGIGSFASVRIPRGHLIHSERPFLYQCPGDYPVAPQDRQDPQWQTWLGLRPPGTSLPEIFRTTSLRCGVTRRNDQHVETSGVFLQAVRFNNSCQPNVHARWNERERCMEFRALKDIAINEELCHCYDPPTLLYSTVERRQRLLIRFGFYCNCTACSQSSPGSDQLRTDLRGRIEVGVPKASSSAQELRDFVRQKTSAIVDLGLAGLYHYADTLHFDLYIAQNQARNTNHAMLCLLKARNLSCAMVGKEDSRVRQMTGMLPTNLRDDFAFWTRIELLPATEGNVSSTTGPSYKDVNGPNMESKPDAEMKGHTNVPEVQAAYWFAEQEEDHVDSPSTAGEPPISLQDDMDIDGPDFKAEVFAVERENADTDESNTHLIQTQDSAQPKRPSPDPNILQLTSAFNQSLTLRESPQRSSGLAISGIGTVASVAHAIAQSVLNRLSAGMLKSARTESSLSAKSPLHKSQSMQVGNPAHELSSSFRDIEALDQLRTVPDKPLVPFLEIAYMLSKRVLGMARSSNIYTTQKVYIARQAMHLLVLLNDSVDMEDPESTQEEEEGIELEDELRAFAKTLKISDEADSAKLDEFHQKFYRPRRYFENNWGGEADLLYSRLKAYDIRTREMKEYQKELNTGPPMIGEGKRSPPVEDTEPIDERDEESQGPTNSVNIRPVSSGTHPRVAQMEM